MVVGEYAGDYGPEGETLFPHGVNFPLPNPVSIHREYLRLRFRVEWCMQKLQKMKLLGIEC